MFENLSVISVEIFGKDKKSSKNVGETFDEVYEKKLTTFPKNCQSVLGKLFTNWKTENDGL